MSGSINIDVSKKLKKLTYNTKGMDKVNIQGLVGDNFLEGITKVVASGNTLSVYINGMKKPLKFTNISDTSEIDIVAGSYSKNLQAFYDEVNSGSTKKWLSRPSATKVAGTVFDETIDLTSGDNKYVPTVKNAKKKVGVTVNAGGGDDTVIATAYNDKIVSGAGDDTITAGVGADTITIDGSGDKIIKIKKGDGDDTIVFKGNGLNAKVTIQFDYDQSFPDFADYSFRKEGNNLFIDRSWPVDESGTMTETTTIKDYFKYNPDIIVKKDNTVSEYSLADFITDLKISGNQSKTNTIVGTNYDDEIKGGKKADKITTANGDDSIYGYGGNDKITINGKGDKDIYIGRNDGNDIILFDLDKVTVTEKINVDIIWNGEPDDTKYTTKNQDLIITNKYNASSGKKAVTQVITIKNYLGNTNKVNLTVGGYNVYGALKSASDAVATETKGTVFDDVLTGTDSADVIYGYSGNDKIVASKGNDKIYGGDGDDTYIYTNFTKKWNDEKYYKDTIYDISGNDRISFTDLSSNSSFFQTQPLLQGTGLFPGFDNLYGCTYIKQGNDLVIGAFESEDVYNRNFPMNRIVLKDYFKSGKGEYGVKIIDNGVNNEDYTSINLADDMMIEHSYRTISALSDHKANKYTGTAYNDYIEGSYKQDVLYGGDGNDIVNGFNCVKGKDYLYGGAGNDILGSNNAYMYGGSGNDTYMSASQDTYREVSTVISDESGYDTVALPIGKYLIYFDVTQENGVVKSTGDIYIKDNTLERKATIDIGNVYATAAGDEDSYTVPIYGGSDRVIKGRIGTLKDSDGTVIKNGTTTGIIENFEMGAYEGTTQHIRYSASYDQARIDDTAERVAAQLQEYGFGSLQEAIKNGTKEQLGALLDIYEAYMLKWTTVIYNEDNTYYYQNTNNSHYQMSDYLPIDDILATYNGTMYSCDAKFSNSIYNYNLNKNTRYSVINDYGGQDSLLLNSVEEGYSFLFDVEVDDKGNLLNYSRDFYVKFKGEEANETGIVIHDGRQERHAIEDIYVGDYNHNVFHYEEATIDTVRQNVAGWLADNGFGSVQEVLYDHKDSVADMMLQFAQINNNE